MIGLCLAFETQNNYGTQLQAYATIKAIQDMGYDVRIIVYHKKYNIKSFILNFKRLFQDKALIGLIKIIKKRIQLRGDSEFARNYRIRKNSVNEFKKKYFFNLVDTYVGYDNLELGSLNYNVIVSGSDQVWLPSGFPSKFYTMMFVSDKIPKMSYASSFGVSTIPVYHQKEAEEFLKRLDFISVRELKGKELVYLHSGRKAEVVVDPTMLLDVKKWIQLCEPVSEGKYIFCYFLGTRRESRIKAQILSKLTGLKIIVLKHLDEYIKEDDNFGDYSPFDVGPERFISFIRHAEYVLTDSFHGTVFSILFNKKFLTFYRFSNNDKLSKNSRIDGLLTQLGLEDRIFKGGDAFTQINQNIDYKTVQTKLDSMRERSKKFLEDSLFECINIYDSRNKQK